MIANGATTIWELWNGNTADPNMNSQNHVMMLGDLLIWYYENLAGIRTDKTAVGFKKIIMKPTLPNGLEFVNASYKSAYGLIKSNWKKNGKELEWNISIPANSSAKIFIPALSANDVAEGGAPLSLSADIKVISWKDGALAVEVPSGNYQFKSIIK
ncbi:unnamed protein product [Rotaria sp. Silwood2]|nr:unnamed protein product [Rotaria sp. Silwood2]